MNLLSVPLSRHSARVAPKPVISSYSSPIEQQNFLPASKIEVIPQFNNTCWFNAILMAMLYSQGLRSFVYKKAKLWDFDLKKNKFKKTLLFILKHNYKNPDKIKELFQKRVKPEFLLFSYLDYYHSSDSEKEIIKSLKTYLNDYYFGFYFHFINEIFSNVFINTLDYLDIYFIDGNLYLGKSKVSVFDSGIDISSLNPNVLLLYHQDFFDPTISKEVYYEIITQVKVDEAYQLPGNIHHFGIDTYQQTIIFNGHTYQLDCCIVRNYNHKTINRGHSIIGLTYDNQPYVYNGWTTSFIITNEYGKNSKEACKLFSRDWKNDLYKHEGNGGFCISTTECDGLKELDKEDLCFDFSKKKDRKILIYVKVEDESKKLLPATSSLVLTSSNTPEKLDYSSSSIEKYIEKYHKLKGKTFSQLSELFLQKTSYKIDDIRLLLVRPGLKNYKILFFILCGKRLSSPITEEDKKAILIALLELYLKDDKIIFFKFLSDDKIHEYLTEETLETTLEKIGYEELLVEKLVITDLINKSYLFLFRALLLSYKYTRANKAKPDINDFLFLLLQAYVIDGYSFNLELYTDSSILNKVLSNLIRLDQINKQIQRDASLEEEEKQEDEYKIHIAEKITSAFELEYEGLEEEKRNELLLPIIKLAIDVIYLMGITRLKNLMESETAEFQLQSGGFRKRQLKSYKKVNK
jgi:hypothetical protein